MRLKTTYIIGIPTITTIIAGFFLTSTFVSADNDSVVDEVNITVPVSCTLSGTGMTSHNAEINNGQYNSAIGESTIKAFCNDNNGFSIYAIGFTNDEYGNNNLTNPTLGSTFDIATGTLTSGATSKWAMKLSTVTSPTPTYPIIIAGSSSDSLKQQGDPDYTAFQEVPDAYDKVAYRTAGTDIGTGVEGSTIKTTYQAYISPTQPSGTYTGQVKYTMVHPYNSETPKREVTKTLEVTYDTDSSDGVFFFDSAKTQTQNVVTYSITCKTETKQFAILKTSNLDDAGIQNGAYGEEDVRYTHVFSNASKVKVIVNYSFTADTGWIEIYGNDDQYYGIYSAENNISDNQTFILNGNYVDIDLETYNTDSLVSGYDYGAFITIIPLDENNQEMSFEKVSDCSYRTVSGAYLRPMYVNGPYQFYGWAYLHSYSSNRFFEEATILEEIIEQDFGNFNQSDAVTVYSTALY